MAAAKIVLQNTLTGKKETFESIRPDVATVYACGPTVYGYTHVGNARTAISTDFVVRVLKLAGYKTEFAGNITDVDDKIIKIANDTGQSSQQVAEHFTKVYLDEMKNIGVLEPDHRPRATESIPEMVTMISGLIQKGMAYAADTPYGQDVYFSVTKFKDYGKLSKRKTEDLLVGARIEAGEAKKDPLDFALWKAAKPSEPSWDSPWGKGRPGWHIECSAMIHGLFPSGIDLHMGGLDLVFPHHENEIAQSESFNSHALSKYWIHCGMLTLQREKMSKSLGNIFSTQKFLDLYGGETLRLMVLQHHYRAPMDFSQESILRAEALLERLYHAKQKSSEHSAATVGELPEELAKLEEQMKEAFFDDFNAAKALGNVLKALRTCFRENRPDYWKAWGRCLPLLVETLGILTLDSSTQCRSLKARRLKRSGITEERAHSIEDRLAKREEARKAKNFAESDRLRKELESEGIAVMDGPDGAAWCLKEAIS